MKLFSFDLVKFQCNYFDNNVEENKIPNMRIEKFIYRNMVQRPSVGRLLDRFGRVLNQAGLPYETGLRRNRATLCAATNYFEREKARDNLNASGSEIARKVVADYEKRKGPLESVKAVSRTFFNSDFHTLGHGAPLHRIEEILHLQRFMSAFDFNQTSYEVFDHDKKFEEQPDSCFEHLLHWPWDNHKNILIIQFPSPNREVTSRLPDNAKDNWLKLSHFYDLYHNCFWQSLDLTRNDHSPELPFEANYYDRGLPGKYIRGYLDVRSPNRVKFIQNELFDPTPPNAKRIDELIKNIQET